MISGFEIVCEIAYDHTIGSPQEIPNQTLQQSHGRQ